MGIAILSAYVECPLITDCAGAVDKRKSERVTNYKCVYMSFNTYFLNKNVYTFAARQNKQKFHLYFCE